MTISETTRQREKREWLEAQSDQVRLNTVLVDRLARCLSDKTPEQVAMHLANCMKNRVWEQGHWDITVSGQFYAHTYENGMEFIRDRLKVEPAELMNMITGVAPDPTEAATAAIELIHEVKASEPETFALMLDPDNTKNWRELLAANERREGGPWIEAAAELDRSRVRCRINQFDGAPVDEQLLQKVKELYEACGNQRQVARELGIAQSSVHRCLRGEAAPVIQSTCDGVPRAKNQVTRRTRLRRQLERYSMSSDLCAAKGTTVERVKQALIDFHNGKSAEACARNAGLVPPSARNLQLRVAGDPDDIAKRLIDKVGATSAQAIADAIKSKLSSN